MSIYYKVYNNLESDRWVTLIHGAGGSSNIWYRQVTAFQLHFNVLVIDLRGHGKSNSDEKEMTSYTFNLIVRDIIGVMDHLNIASSHFVGISLGSLLIKLLEISNKERVESMVLGGSIVKLNFKSSCLLFFGNIFKKVIPFMWLYVLFASIILPRKNHMKSRLIFIREAKKLDREEFLKWFSMTKDLSKVLKKIRTNRIKRPALFIQGSEDHMFLGDVKNYIKNNQKSTLKIINKCGHVVNIEASQEFNDLSIFFIKNLIDQEKSVT